MLSKALTQSNLLKQSRHFAKWVTPKNDHLDPEYIKKQKDLFETTLSKREQAYKMADRLALNEIKKEALQDPTLWWNKLGAMNEEERDLLPFSFVKKYGTFINSINELQLMNKHDDNLRDNNRGQEIKVLDKLLTNEEKREM